MEKLLTLQQTSQVLGLAVATLRRKAKAGELGCVRTRERFGRYLFRVEDLERWISEHERPARGARIPA